MANVLMFVLFALGIVLIVKGGDYFVDASSWIAESFGIPKFIVGATIVSFATTLPELLVSIFAALQNKTDMAIGNAVGSVTANVGLIMAISIIFLPSAIKRRSFGFKAIMMCLVIGLLWAFCSRGELNLFGAIILILLFVTFIVENLFDAKKSISINEESKKSQLTKKDVTINVLKFVFGAAGIVGGAQLLVDNGSSIALLLGVPEAIISVTIIAIGTSLPELVTTVTALVKKQANLSIGNIVGANILDLTLIMPICSLIKGGSLPVKEQSMLLDLPVCAIVCAISIIPTLILGKFKRVQGFVILATYIAYIVLMMVFFL